jgi:hypothetical protein
VNIVRCLTDKKLKLSRNEKRDLITILALSSDVGSFGTMPQILHEIGSGRFASYKFYSLMNKTQRVREIVLAGFGFYQFDFEACHPTIALWLLGYLCPNEVPAILIESVHDKQRFRDRIHEESKVPAANVKSAINAVLNGSPLSTNNECSLRNDIGELNVIRLQQSSTFLE